MSTPTPENVFLERFEAVLTRIERAVEASGADIESDRAGNVLTLEFGAGSTAGLTSLQPGSKIIVNSQAALEEIWVAAKSGGFHYRFNGTDWRDTRDGSEFFATLAALIARQAGIDFRF